VQSSSTLPRLVAPLALIAIVVAIAMVVTGSLGDGSGSRGSGEAEQIDPVEQPVEQTSSKRSYVVQPGDTLSVIAEETGVPVDELTQLNPGLDPQALLEGQRVKLR
jgi:LysM repeat protein